MAWTSPRTYTVGEIITKAILDAHVRDNLRYLKGLDGVPTVESGLIIDNTGGDEYLKLPLLSTAECTTVLDAEGEVAHDEQTHRIKLYDGTAVRSLVSTADVDDTPANGADTDPISSNWAFDHLALLTTAGDIIYATGAGVWARLGIGTAGQRLRVNAGANAPEWATTGQTQEFFVPCGQSTGDLTGTRYSHQLLNANGELVNFSFHIPADFTVLTSVKVIFWVVGTGTIDWTVNSYCAADGEAYTSNTDTATADGLAVTNQLMQELDISAAFTNVAANDAVGCQFIVDTFTTTTIVNVVGLKVKYT